MLYYCVVSAPFGEKASVRHELPSRYDGIVSWNTGKKGVKRDILLLYMPR